MAEDTALSTGASPDYADAILKFLEDREPLDVLAQTPADLRAAVAGLSPEALQTPEKHGKWGIAAVVKHLADAELVLAFRYRNVIAKPGDIVHAFDQDAWADALGYLNADVPAALDDFEAVRGVNLRFLHTVTPEQWDLFAVHDERGKETLRHMVRLYAAHDCYHLYQIARIKKAIGA